MNRFIVPEIDRDNLALRRRYELLEIIHLPIHVFHIGFPTGVGKMGETTAGVDGLVGEFAFLNKNGLRVTDTPKGDFFPPVVDVGSALEVVTENFRWRRIQLGLKSRRSLNSGQIVYEDVRYYPFWVGYYHKGGKVRFHCWDAVSGKRGGIKTRRALMVAFLKHHHRQAGTEVDHG